MEIKNKQFRAALEAAGLEKYHLWKDNGYFHVYSDDPDLALELTKVANSIYLCNFRDQSIENWVNQIKGLDYNIKYCK